MGWYTPQDSPGTQFPTNHSTQVSEASRMHWFHYQILAGALMYPVAQLRMLQYFALVCPATQLRDRCDFNTFDPIKMVNVKINVYAERSVCIPGYTSLGLGIVRPIRLVGIHYSFVACGVSQTIHWETELWCWVGYRNLHRRVQAILRHPQIVLKKQAFRTTAWNNATNKVTQCQFMSVLNFYARNHPNLQAGKGQARNCVVRCDEGVLSFELSNFFSRFSWNAFPPAFFFSPWSSANSLALWRPSSLTIKPLP